MTVVVEVVSVFLYLLGNYPTPVPRAGMKMRISLSRAKNVAGKPNRGSDTLVASAGQVHFVLSVASLLNAPSGLSHLGGASRHLGRSLFRTKGPFRGEAAGVPLPRSERRNRIDSVMHTRFSDPPRSPPQFVEFGC